MKIFIIGGTGLMGPSLVREIEIGGHNTTCYNRRGIHPKNGHSLKGDRNDNKSLRNAILDLKPDVVIDMIPYTEEHAVGLGRVLKESKSRLIACSSIDVYRAYNIIHRLEGPPYQSCPIQESDELRSTLGADGKEYDKLNVERQYLSLEVDVTIIRLPAIYGWPDQRRVRQYVDQIEKEGKITMHPDEANWRSSRALNKNCAYAISLGLEECGKSIYNVGESNSYTEAEWCRKIGAFLGWNGEIELNDNLDPGGDAKQDWTVETRLIRDNLGYHEKYDCDRGLQESVIKYRDSEQIASANTGRPVS